MTWENLVRSPWDPSWTTQINIIKFISQAILVDSVFQTAKTSLLMKGLSPSRDSWRNPKKHDKIPGNYRSSNSRYCSVERTNRSRIQV